MKLRRLELKMDTLASTFPSRVLVAAGEPETEKQDGRGPAQPREMDADMVARVVWVDGSFIPFEAVARATPMPDTIAAPPPKLAAGGRKR